MRVIDLIRHYDRRRSARSPMSVSLSRKLVQLMGAFGDLPADVEGAEIEERAALIWRNASASTRKRMLVQLRAIFTQACRDKLIASAPYIETPAVYDVAIVELSTREAKLLLDHMQWAEARWYGLALLLAHAGPRLGEALRWTPGSDVLHGSVRFRRVLARQSKTVERLVPMTPRLAAAVADGSPFARWPELRGYAEGSVSAMLGRSLAGACEALGLPRLGAHDLRHVFAGIAAEHGADLGDLQALLGHTNPAQSMRYRGQVRPKAAAILSAVS